MISTKVTKEYSNNKKTNVETPQSRYPSTTSIPRISEEMEPCFPSGSPNGQWHLVLVDDGAVLPDLALGACLDLDGAQLHHGRREHLEEHLGRRVHHEEDVGLGRRVGEQRRVRLEQAPALEHAPVVAQVEGPEAAGVHLDDGGVVRQRLALGPPQVVRVRRVQRRVGVAGAAAAGEVVEALAEGVAVPDADGVSPCVAFAGDRSAAAHKYSDSKHGFLRIVIR